MPFRVNLSLLWLRSNFDLPYGGNSNSKMPMSEPKKVKIDQPNEAGFAIIRVRENGDYKEGASMLMASKCFNSVPGFWSTTSAEV